jgi:hypothetical protein
VIEHVAGSHDDCDADHNTEFVQDLLLAQKRDRPAYCFQHLNLECDSSTKGSQANRRDRRLVFQDDGLSKTIFAKTTPRSAFFGKEEFVRPELNAQVQYISLCLTNQMQGLPASLRQNDGVATASHITMKLS